jgi:hypothetical protein
MYILFSYLALSNIRLFQRIKSALKGRIFQDIENIKKRVTSLKAVPQQEFQKMFQTSLDLWISAQLLKGSTWWFLSVNCEYIRISLETTSFLELHSHTSHGGQYYACTDWAESIHTVFKTDFFFQIAAGSGICAILHASRLKNITQRCYHYYASLLPACLLTQHSYTGSRSCYILNRTYCASISLNKWNV